MNLKLLNSSICPATGITEVVLLESAFTVGTGRLFRQGLNCAGGVLPAHVACDNVTCYKRNRNATRPWTSNGDKLWSPWKIRLKVQALRIPSWNQTHRYNRPLVFSGAGSGILCGYPNPRMPKSLTQNGTEQRTQPALRIRVAKAPPSDSGARSSGRAAELSKRPVPGLSLQYGICGESRHITEGG